MTEPGVIRALGKRESQASNLPPPAAKLAYRLAQLARSNELVTAQVVIVDGLWYLQVNGRNERLGK